MNQAAYIILQRSDLDHTEYETSPFLQGSRMKYIKKLRQLLNFINPATYRGTGRREFLSAPFWVDDSGLLDVYPDTDLGAVDNIEARKQLAVYEKENTTASPDYFFILSPDQIRDVYALITNKADYEICEIIAGQPFTNERTLGFDIGFMGGDFFSAIADVAIKPMWNPAHLDDIDAIIPHLKRLNEACLFNSLEEATAYRQAYPAKAWAERESYEGQITIIQVRSL